MYQEQSNDHEEFWDSIGDILVIRKGSKVVGGARLLQRYCVPPGDTLPMEADGFTLSELLPAYNLLNLNYCEFSRLIVIPELRNGEFTREIVRQLISRALEHRCSYIFAETTLAKARIFRRLCAKMGLQAQGHANIPGPKRAMYTHYNPPLELYLFSVDLSSLVIAYPQPVAA